MNDAIASIADILDFIAALIGDEWPIFLPFVGLLILFIGLGAAGRWRRRRRMAMLRAEAARFGWQPITDPTPGPVAEALRSDRCKIALGARHQGHQIWMIYHHWTESSGDDTARVHDLTRYFLVLGAGYPYIRLHRRQRIDERWLKSIIDGWLGLRDFHTGHAGFDTRFAFEAPATVEPRRLLTPPLVEAMVAGRLPLWEIDEGVLVTRHLGEPTIATLRRRADSIVHLAGMLPGRHA